MAYIPHDVGILLSCVLIAFFGGGIRTALSGPDQPMKAVLVYAGACGFTGLVVSLSLLYFGVAQPYLLLLLAALAGWVGPSVVETLAGVASMRIGAKLGTPLNGAPQASQPPVEVHVHTGSPMQQPSAYLQAPHEPVIPADRIAP